MDAVTVQALADVMMVIFNAVALFLQQAISGTLGLNLPITLVALFLLGLLALSISRSSVLGLVAIGAVFLFMMNMVSV